MVADSVYYDICQYTWVFRVVIIPGNEKNSVAWTEFHSVLYVLFQKKLGNCLIISLLEGTARYAGLLLAPAEGFCLRPRPLWRLANPFFCLQVVNLSKAHP